MRFREYDWDDVNIAHIAKHGVTSQEVEEACAGFPMIMQTRNRRYLVYGRDDRGRYLLVVIAYKGGDRLRVITARDMNDPERRLYHRKKD